ncbi:hypothetical protein IE53DRAFT_386162 [Violaceomyces palustris]|uniref:Uncharacterized protein n=1 Tax=Violaceomyces palustris TaxID=1673888 RepID=A0ACD0P082_9BASI|nr:hypothetical protein IE53DRAFT_386162 [Violaceomyces palustris]
MSQSNTKSISNQPPQQRQPSPSPSPSSSQDLTKLLGSSVKVTTTFSSLQGSDQAIGRLWAYDSTLGLLALELPPSPLDPILSSAPASALASSSTSTSTSTTNHSSSSNNSSNQTSSSFLSSPSSTTPTTNVGVGVGFRIIKVSEIRSIEFLPTEFQDTKRGGSGDGGSGGGAGGQDGVDGLSLSTHSSQHLADSLTTTVHPVSFNAVQAREANAVKQSLLKAARTGGKDVSEMGQLVFDALSKTLPCRWHGPHIIVLEEVVISGPQYDPSSTNVPNFTQEQLRSISDGTTSSSVAEGSKAKANSWNRVIKVLEGERRKILARQALEG